MELGKLQKAWVASLKKHPERQTTDILGEKSGSSYIACCLGELLICDARLKHKKMPFIGDNLIDGIDPSVYDAESLLIKSYKKFGLHSNDGDILTSDGFSYSHIWSTGYGHNTLSRANDDSGIKWPEIAEFIEQNPEKVFTKSV